MGSQIIQLSLSQTPDGRRADTLAGLCDHLLDLLASQAPDAARLRSDAFRLRLERWRQELRAGLDPDPLARLARRIEVDTAAFFEEVRAHLADREVEFREVVRVVREVLDVVRSGARQFERELMDSATALEQVAGLDDLGTLRRALVRQAEAIRRLVTERQETEARQFEQLTARMQALERTLAHVRAEAATDPLTGIPNRGAFDVMLRDWLARAARERYGFSLALVDLDDFKRINDTHGHQVGDRVLLAATQLLAGALREGEVVARYGGEEFALLLATASASEARDRLEALLQRVPPAYEYDLAGEKRFLSFTFSAGVTDHVEGDTPVSMVRRADEALYEAKRRGKHRVAVRSRSLLRVLIG